MTRKPQHEFFAIQVAMRCGAPGWGREQVRNLARRPETLRLAIQCAAAIGDPAVVPWLLGQTRDPRHGRIAGDAFWIITGADFEYLGLKQDAPEQDPPDARPEDSSLYWPDANGLAAWWNRERRRFQQGQRYLAGQPVSAKSALDALRTCSQRHRQAAAIELARADQTGPLFPIRDRSDRQDRQLAR